jgi:hypothetical protein
VETQWKRLSANVEKLKMSPTKAKVLKALSKK